MTNRVVLIGKLLDDPRVRTFETRKGEFETVSLWIETVDNGRTDRFTVDVLCPKAGASAKAMRAGVIAEVHGKLRHDRWKDPETNRWIGKVYVAIDPGEGLLCSQGLAPDAQRDDALAA
jgi:single-stranded DNA-binding protein